MAWTQRAVAGVAAVFVAYLAWASRWPFDAKPANVESFRDPSIWQYLLSDKYVLGALQLGLTALALYIFVSVPALAVAARWAKAFGTSGVATDDAAQAKKTLEDYEKELAAANTKLDTANETIGRMKEQRDEAFRLLSSVTSTTTPTSAKAPSSPIVSKEGESDDANGHQDQAG